MAAHVMRHGNEMVPNTFPPPRPTPKDHGIMSQYEAPFVMHQTCPFPEIEGGLEVTFDEDQPVIHKPVPTSTRAPSFDLGEVYDLSLCVTPEKNNLRKTRTEKLNRGSDEGTSLKPRNSQKVRFENFVEVKRMSPEVSPSRTEQSVSLSQSSIPISEPQVITVGSNDTDGQYSHMEESSGDVQVSPEPAQNELTDPISVLASDLRASKLENMSAKLSSSRQSRFKGSNSRPVTENSDSGFGTGTTSEHILARPEFNSTLRVGKELQQLSEAELDVPAAVKQKLAKSNKTKVAIDEKATSRVNTCSNQYQGLVSLDIQEGDLIDSIQRDRSKTKPAAVTKPLKAEDALVSPPDILDCLTADLIRETGSFTLSGIPSHNNTPQVTTFQHAFDVYRHVRSWENW